ncbi:unnamed protein product [Heligmosomoides polygyrus]|uniref:Uncharacterized protein n=1 Tax=Heligmosomoides polygyrus TaxID=6339 RepID=A0A3P8AL84_HELPZ|nr:unnamed protein product [Heligmosomoides polygyrus]
MTGTVIEGRIRVDQEIEIPALKEKKKVKGLESWKELCQTCLRVGFSRFRFLVIKALFSVCSPGLLTEVKSCIASVNVVSFYRGTTSSGMKVHVSTGFDTVMAECQFLRPEGEEFEQLSTLEAPCVCWMTFDRPVYSRVGSFYIASKLDHQGRGCRFLFHGHFDEILKAHKVRRFLRRVRSGRAERVENPRSIVCNSLFKKETKMSLFEGMPVSLSTGEVGRVVGAFGKGGKARLEIGEVVEVHMHLKKYLGEKTVAGYLPPPNC